jgi:hypothetical protein
MRNEKISSELFAKIRKKLSLAEKELHGEGKNVACEKEQALQKGKRSLQTGKRYWETGRK